MLGFNQFINSINSISKRNATILHLYHILFFKLPVSLLVTHTWHKIEGWRPVEGILKAVLRKLQASLSTITL